MKDRAENRGISRPAEIALTIAGIFLLSPLFLLIPLLIKFSSHGAVLFRQKRVGLGGKEFVLYKFRSMHDKAGGVRLTATNDLRLTKVGKWLRRYKLDELPQLWNVLRGEMSLVGPRPEVPEYVDLENPLWNEILSVRPGITDPISIRLRNEERLLSKAENKEIFYKEILLPFKLRGWAEYARRKSFGNDLSIILKTFKAILLPNTVPPPTLDELMISDS
ncbi:MAG: sugar transferase [Pyrinomonadaceae bacterium]|nr:sugar transferase [Pyrinomonadaceae bacterium]